MTSWGQQEAQIRSVLAGNFIGALLHEPVHWVLDEFNKTGDAVSLEELNPKLSYVVPSIAWVDEYQIGAGTGAPTLSAGELWFEWHWPKRTRQEELVENAGFLHETLSRRSFAGFQFFEMARRDQGTGASHYILRQAIPFEHCDVWSSRPFSAPSENEGGTMATGSRTYNQPGHGLAVGAPVRQSSEVWVGARADDADHLARGVVTRVLGSYITVATRGFVLAESHGLGAAGTKRWTSQVTAGASVTVEPVNGWRQELLEVFDVDNLLVNVMPGDYL
jgi:hypothetical protein